jgi:hypothetical protein
MKYNYTFALHPAHGATFSKWLHEYHNLMPMVTLDMTEDEFEQMRYALKLDGFELHEVTRVPYREPETVVVI